MATLWVREFSKVPKANIDDGYGRTVPAPIVHEPGVNQTPVTYSTEAKSAVFSDETRYIMIISDAAFHYEVGINPTATTNSMLFPANMPHWVGVEVGDKISVVAA